MKKIGVLILFLLIISMFNLGIIYAEDNNTNNQTSLGDEGTGQQDVDRILNLTDQIPLTEEGKLDEEKFQGYKSKAEQRIDTINLWLEENASWLSWVFGMKPEISWLFALNIVFMLFFLWGLVFVLPDVAPFSENISRLIGVGLFIIVMVTKTTVKLSGHIIDFTSKWWIKLIIVVVLGILISISAVLGRYFKKKKREMKDEYNRQRLESGAEIADTFKEAFEK